MVAESCLKDVGTALMASFGFILAAWGVWLKAIVRRRVPPAMVSIIDNYLFEILCAVGFVTGLGIFLAGKLS